MTAVTPTNVLIVEDDPKVAASLAQGLTEAGYHVATAGDGEEGFFRFARDKPELVVLDLNLPRRDGFEILQSMRATHPETRILIVSARDAVEDRVRGLDLGADDYLVKPFAFSELLARLRVLQRRGVTEPTLELRVADLEVDVLDRRVTRGGRRVDLTPREFQILEILLRNHGTVVARHTIARDVWKVQRATPLDNVIDVHLMRLRRKVDGAGQTPLIHTVRGLGVMLNETPPAE